MLLEQLLSKTDTINEEISHYPKLDDGVLEKYAQHFAVTNTYNSNAIEGSTLTLSDTHLVLVEGITIDQRYETF